MDLKEKIEKYLHREQANVCEQEDFERWIIENTTNPDVNQYLFDAFLAQEDSVPENEQIEKSFERLLISLGGNYDFFKKKYNRTRKLAFSLAFCCMLSLMSVAFGVWAMWSRETQQVTLAHTPEWKEIYVPAGQIDTLVMNDGSIFYLNSNTRITYPSFFHEDKDSREVFIDGEVYAEVAKNPEKPLIIHGINNDVKVLGTSFCYSNYRYEDKASLALLTGQLQMSLRTPDGKRRNVEIVPGSKISVNKKTGNFFVGDFDVSLFHTFHHNGGLKFDNCTLADIAEVLERKYAVNILIKNTQLANTKYFAVISQGQSAMEILRNLNADKKMKITQNNNNKIITISQSN